MSGGGAGQFVVNYLTGPAIWRMRKPAAVCVPFATVVPDVYRTLVTTTMVTGKGNKCGKARGGSDSIRCIIGTLSNIKMTSERSAGKAIESLGFHRGERKRIHFAAAFQ